MKLKFTTAQLEWLSRNLGKLAERKTAKGEREQAILNGLVRKCQPSALYVDLNRNELRAIENVAKLAHTALTSNIIPTYEARGEAEYRDYIERAQATATQLEGLLKIVRKAL